MENIFLLILLGSYRFYLKPKIKNKIYKKNIKN